MRLFQSQPEHEVFYVAYGAPARYEARVSVDSLRVHHPKWRVMVCTDDDSWGSTNHHLAFLYGVDDPKDRGARRVKLHADRLTMCGYVLYLDADTRVLGDLSSLLSPLADGWEIVLAPSTRQGADVLGHLSEEDRSLTLRALQTENGVSVLGLQCGVMAFRKTAAVAALFAAWREEWERFKDQDQGAFLRALHRCPVRLWLVGNLFNCPAGPSMPEDAVIEHHFGAAKRRP